MAGNYELGMFVPFPGLERVGNGDFLSGDDDDDDDDEDDNDTMPKRITMKNNTTKTTTIKRTNIKTSYIFNLIFSVSLLLFAHFEMLSGLLYAGFVVINSQYETSHFDRQKKTQ